MYRPYITYNDRYIAYDHFRRDLSPRYNDINRYDSGFSESGPYYQPGPSNDRLVTFAPDPWAQDYYQTSRDRVRSSNCSPDYGRKCESHRPENLEYCRPFPSLDMQRDSRYRNFYETSVNNMNEDFIYRDRMSNRNLGSNSYNLSEYREADQVLRAPRPPREKKIKKPKSKLDEELDNSPKQNNQKLTPAAKRRRRRRRRERRLRKREKNEKSKDKTNNVECSELKQPRKKKESVTVVGKENGSMKYSNTKEAKVVSKINNPEKKKSLENAKSVSQKKITAPKASKESKAVQTTSVPQNAKESNGSTSSQQHEKSKTQVTKDASAKDGVKEKRKAEISTQKSSVSNLTNTSCPNDDNGRHITRIVKNAKFEDVHLFHLKGAGKTWQRPDSRFNPIATRQPLKGNPFSFILSPPPPPPPPPSSSSLPQFPERAQQHTFQQNHSQLHSSSTNAMFSKNNDGGVDDYVESLSDVDEDWKEIMQLVDDKARTPNYHNQEPRCSSVNWTPSVEQVTNFETYHNYIDGSRRPMNSFATYSNNDLFDNQTSFNEYPGQYAQSFNELPSLSYMGTSSRAFNEINRRY